MTIRVKGQHFIQRFIFAATALLLLSGSSAADVVVEWNAIAVDAPPPAVVGPAHARILGYVHAAIYDAVNGIDRRHAPYMVTASAPAGASAEAAAAAAAHGVLARLYPAQKATFDAALAKSLQAIPDGTAKTDGATFGTSVAERIFAVSQEDGAAATVDYQYGKQPWSWRPTAPGMTPRLAQWGKVKPFLIENVAQFSPPGPLPVDGAAYAKEINEVNALGGADSVDRTSRQTATAIFWTVSTPVPFNALARGAAKAKEMGLVESARLFALLNMAGSDSQIVTWEAKYRVGLLRPVTAIRQASTLGNPAIRQDAKWDPLIENPGHPDYPSGHCALTGAAVAVLQHFFGDDATIAATSVTWPLLGVTRSWKTFSDLSKEVIDARVWGGIHTRTADEHADQLGRKVADYAIAKLK
jgi:lipoprotein-anchoring transpeptidase ErfK/SrfK